VNDAGIAAIRNELEHRRENLERARKYEGEIEAQLLQRQELRARLEESVADLEVALTEATGDAS